MPGGARSLRHGWFVDCSRAGRPCFSGRGSSAQTAGYCSANSLWTPYPKNRAPLVGGGRLRHARCDEDLFVRVQRDLRIEALIAGARDLHHLHEERVEGSEVLVAKARDRPMARRTARRSVPQRDSSAQLPRPPSRCSYFAWNADRYRSPTVSETKKAKCSSGSQSFGDGGNRGDWSACRDSKICPIHLCQAEETRPAILQAVTQTARSLPHVDPITMPRMRARNQPVAAPVDGQRPMFAKPVAPPL